MFHEIKFVENKGRKSEDNNCNEKIYLEQNISKLQEEIYNHRENLITQIFNIREREINLKYSCNSDCQPGCKIFHQKQNWIKTESGDLFDRLNTTRIHENFRRQLCYQSLGNIHNCINTLEVFILKISMKNLLKSQKICKNI